MSVDEVYTVLLLVSWLIIQGKPYNKQVTPTQVLQKDEAKPLFPFWTFSLRPRAFNEQGSLCFSSCLCARYIEAILCMYCWIFLRYLQRLMYPLTVTGFRGDIRELISPFLAGKGQGEAACQPVERISPQLAKTEPTADPHQLYGQNVIPVGKITALTHKSVHTPLISSSMKCLFLQICCTGTRKTTTQDNNSNKKHTHKKISPMNQHKKKLSQTESALAF